VIVTSITGTTILVIVNAVIGDMPEPSQDIGVLWGCWELSNDDNGLHACYVIPIIDDYTAARWV